jgi:hypothetical protein
MRIAQIIPTRFRSMQIDGGVERAAQYLARQLVSDGHEVTVFSWIEERPAVLGRRAGERSGDAQGALDVLAAQASDFDIIHCHDDFPRRCALAAAGTPVVLTMHRYVDARALRSLAAKMPAALVPLCEAQRRASPGLMWSTPIPYGAPHWIHRFSVAPGEYILYVGPLLPNHGIETAVEIAALSGVPLKIAGRARAKQRAYIRDLLLPEITASGAVAEFCLDPDSRETERLIGGACALLWTADWPEEAVRAVADLHEISRLACRRAFDDRFSAQLMARRYVELYDAVIRQYRLASVTVMSCLPQPSEFFRR